MSLAVACTLVLSGICLHHIQEIRLNDGGTPGSATIHADDFDAEIRQDTVYPTDWKRMEDACEEGVCIAYHKWCRDDGTFCRYHFSRLDDTRNIVIEITARDHAALLRSESSIGVIAGKGWSMTEVPLSRFYAATPWEYPPYCNLEPRPACWPRPGSR